MYSKEEAINIAYRLKPRIVLSKAIEYYSESKICPYCKRSDEIVIKDDPMIWHCFACNSGGNLWNYIMRVFNLSFEEAVHKFCGHNFTSLIRQGILKRIYKGKIMEKKKR